MINYFLCFFLQYFWIVQIFMHSARTFFVCHMVNSITAWFFFPDKKANGQTHEEAKGTHSNTLLLCVYNAATFRAFHDIEIDCFYGCFCQIFFFSSDCFFKSIGEHNLNAFWVLAVDISMVHFQCIDCRRNL